MWDFFFPLSRSPHTLSDMRSECMIWAGRRRQQTRTSTECATYDGRLGQRAAQPGHDNFAPLQLGGKVLVVGHARRVSGWVVVSERKATHRRAIAAAQLHQSGAYSLCGARQPTRCAHDQLEIPDGLHEQVVAVAFNDGRQTIYITDAIHFVFRHKKLEARKSSFRLSPAGASRPPTQTRTCGSPLHCTST
jgi:hypothetical protein